MRQPGAHSCLKLAADFVLCCVFYIHICFWWGFVLYYQSHARHSHQCSDGHTAVKILNAIKNRSRGEALSHVPVPRPNRFSAAFASVADTLGSLGKVFGKIGAGTPLGVRDSLAVCCLVHRLQ